MARDGAAGDVRGGVASLGEAGNGLTGGRSGGGGLGEMISTDTTALIAAVLADLPPDEQTGLMVLTMTAYIETAREAGMTEANIEISLRVLCGTRTKEAAMRPPAWFQ